jgi:ubiquinone biosynthesis protein
VVVLELLLGLPIAWLAALVAARLLGVRRSWVAVCTAGTTGWAGALLLSGQLADWDWDTVAVSAQTVVFTIVFTMLAAVSLDLLARPGSLARGDRAGLVVLPRPLHDLRRSLAPYARYREIARIARRNGLLARPRHGRLLEERSVGVALRTTLEQAGIVFVKLGQMASTRQDLLPNEITTELAKLQSNVEPAPREAMQEQLETELGGPVEDFFDDFDWSPLGSASIAHAYTARLRTGERVIVKVQRPDMDDLVARDTAALLHLARAIERRTPIGRDLHVEEFAAEFARNLHEELDFFREGANAIDISSAIDGNSAIRVPQVYEELTTRRVLVEERFDGTSVADSARIAQLGVDTTKLADALVAAMVDQLMYGHFHADPHPGNVMLLDDGTLALIDFGMTGRLDPAQRAALLQITMSAVRQDVSGLRDGLEAVAIFDAALPDAAFDRALGRFLNENVRPGQALDADAMNELVRLLTAFDVRLPSEMTACLRALVLLDGTARVIQPDYSLIDGMRRVLDPTDGASRAAANAQDELKNAVVRELPRLQKLPAQMDRIATLAARGDLRARISLFSTFEDARVVTTLVNRITLALTGGLLALAGALLLTVGTGANNRETTLTEVFGYIALGFAAVVLLRVVAAVVRDG